VAVDIVQYGMKSAGILARFVKENNEIELAFGVDRCADCFGISFCIYRGESAPIFRN
jgi:hypothetical protein